MYDTIKVLEELRKKLDDAQTLRMANTIKVLEELRKKLDDAQTLRMANAHIEANKHYYTVGYGDGLHEAILMLDVAIKEEKEKKRLRESAGWGY